MTSQLRRRQSERGRKKSQRIISISRGWREKIRQSAWIGRISAVFSGQRRSFAATDWQRKLAFSSVGISLLFLSVKTVHRNSIEGIVTSEIVVCYFLSITIPSQQRHFLSIAHIVMSSSSSSSSSRRSRQRSCTIFFLSSVVRLSASVANAYTEGEYVRWESTRHSTSDLYMSLWLSKRLTSRFFLSPRRERLALLLYLVMSSASVERPFFSLFWTGFVNVSTDAETSLAWENQ